MKKFFPFLCIIVVCFAAFSIVGCNGLWGFDEDDDVVTPAGTKFSIGGSVSTIKGTNLRAAVVDPANDNLEAVVCTMDEKGVVTPLAGIETSAVKTDGSYLCVFYSKAAYYVIQIRIKNSKVVMMAPVGQLDGTVDKSTGQNVTPTTTTQVLLMEKAGQQIPLTDLSYDTNPDVKKISDTLADTGLKDVDTLNVGTVVETTGIAATAVKINNVSPVSLSIGSKVVLAATITPAYATDKVAWAVTSGAGFVTLNGNEVTGQAEGTAVLTATVGSLAPVEVTINVVSIPVSTVTITNKPSTIERGKTIDLGATVLPADATNRTVTWSSSSPSDVSVSSTGTIQGLKATTAPVTITATAGGKSDSFIINVVVPVNTFIINNKIAVIEQGKTADLSVSIDPADATDQTVTWTSSNSAVTVTKTGALTATINGVNLTTSPVTITATAGGKSDTFNVSVAAAVMPVDTVTIAPKPVTVELGKSVEITVTVLPNNATDKSVSITSPSAAVTITKLTDTTFRIDGATETTAPVTITAAAGGKSDSFNISVVSTKSTFNLTNKLSTGASDFEIWVEDFGSADLTGLSSVIIIGTKSYNIVKDSLSSSTRYVLRFVGSEVGTELLPFDIQTIELSGAVIPTNAKITIWNSTTKVQVFTK